MRTLLAFLTAAGIAAVLTDLSPLDATPAPQVGPFHQACATLPFDAIKKARDIDQHCDVAGNATASGDQEQNKAKNNFCAAGPPVWTTFFTFKQIQIAAVAAVGTGMPDDRSALADLHTTSEGDTVGEGAVVELIGFLIKGKFSNVGSGETVNCKLGDREENDIHLNVVQTKPPANPTEAQLKDLECASAVVEISPHFRPETWEQLGTLQKTSANATAAKKIAALDLRRPMRFTGQAMFDANHQPCTGTTPHGSSRRISAWEIHPAYAIDVCINTSLSACPRNQANRWKPLHKWLEALDDEQDQ
jgi:hypothetical protein